MHLHGGANSVSQVVGVSDVAPTCQFCGSARGQFRIGTVASACLSAWEKAAHQLLPWWQTLQFLLICHWYLSSCSPKAGAQRKCVLSKFACEFFKRNCLGLQRFLRPTHSLLGFTAICYGVVLVLEPWAGGRELVWGWDPSLLRYPSQIFIHLHGLGPACSTSPCLHPSYQSGWMWLFNSVVVGLPFKLISDSSEWWLYYI